MGPQELTNLGTDARPRLSWRIGVSGHIELPEAHVIELNRQLAQVFDDVAAGLAAVQKRPDAEYLFAPGAPVISLVSSLAVGADRLAAAMAARRGFELRVPLPFEVAEYKRDFPNSTDAFDKLLQLAGNGGVVELDGKTEHGPPRNGAYMAAGEFVLRNCDLLVAIWNGKAAGGLGGTGDVVARALQFGVPVVHIHSTGPQDMLISVTGANTPTWTGYSPARLAASIATQIIPKVSQGYAREQKGPSLRPAEIYFRKEPLADTGKEPDFLYQGPFAPRMPLLKRALAHVFPAFVKVLGKEIAVEQPVRALPPGATSEPTTRYLFLHHHRADVLATFYANVHRGAFLLVYALGALALSCAVAAVYFAEHVVPLIGLKAMYFFTGLELAVLIALAALMTMDNGFRWRDRWLEYRLLAELLREADLLAQVGRPMPIAKIEELVQDLPGRAWVGIAYCAIIRRVGLVTQKFDAAFLDRLRDYVADTRLQDQIAYHRKAEARNESVAHALRIFGLIAFWGTVAVAIVKLAFHEIADELLLGLLAGVLPALAYACFGIRSQAEFEIVSRRSERMIAKLSRHKQHMKALQGDTLTSEALGREILQAAGVMRHDAADWTSIFEVKETETVWLIASGGSDQYPVES